MYSSGGGGGGVLVAPVVYFTVVVNLRAFYFCMIVGWSSILSLEWKKILQVAVENDWFVSMLTCIAFTIRPQDRDERKGQLNQSQCLSRCNQGIQLTRKGGELMSNT